VRIHAIQTGSLVVRAQQLSGKGSGPLRGARTLMDRNWTDPMPIYAWLIEHPEGLIVVDTGESARVNEPGYLPRWHPYFRRGVRESVEPGDEIGPQLTALGSSAEDVRWVVLTHLHNDHTGGLAHFPHSEILVCRVEFDNAKGFAGQMRGFLPQHWPEWFSPQLYDFDDRPFGPFPQSRPLTEAGDVTIVATHGHSKGHASVVVEEDEHAVFLAGDTSYTQALMIDGAVDGVTQDVRTASESLGRIREFARQRRVVYLPSHDPQAAQRLDARETLPR
jgi:N-acyl homoserine lactone hydrolase